jgi:hypothetical protein
MLVNFLLPVSAILLGVSFLGETIAPRHVLGMAVIAIGLAALDGRPYRALAAAVSAGPEASAGTKRRRLSAREAEKRQRVGTGLAPR